MERKACCHVANAFLSRLVFRANSADIQLENLQNFQKIHSWQKALGVDGLIKCQVFQNMSPLVGDMVINLGNLSKESPKTGRIPHNADVSFFCLVIFFTDLEIVASNSRQHASCTDLYISLKYEMHFSLQRTIAFVFFHSVTCVVTQCILRCVV